MTRGVAPVARSSRFDALVVLALLASLASLPGCERESEPPNSETPPSEAAQPVDSPPPSAEPAVAEVEGTGTEAPEPIHIGFPTALDELPEGWPPQIPHPPGMIVERQTAAEQARLMLAAIHTADREALLDWFVSWMAEDGWLVLQHNRLGSSSRVRMAKDRARWLLVVGERLNADGERETWVNVTEQFNEQAVSSLPGLVGAWDCTTALATTPPRAPIWCELHVGRAFESPPHEMGQQDAALGDDEVAFVVNTGAHVVLMTLRDGEVERPPTTLTLSDDPSGIISAPQVLAGEDGGWLVSWIVGAPLERVALHVDARLRPTDRRLVLSRELGYFGDAAWVPIAMNDNSEFAAAWIEQSPATETADISLAFRVAGVKRNGDRIRRSGRFPVRGAEPSIGPALVYDGGRHLGLVWGSSDGVMFRSVGTDGLPNQPERRLEPGPPAWVSAMVANDSFWITWATSRSGFWIRTNLEGCVDNARGSLRGIPEQAWSSQLGPIVQVRDGSEIRLVRLADRGGDEPDRSPEIVGTSHLRVDWSDFESVAGGFRGIVHTDAGFATAEWVCEETSD